MSLRDEIFLHRTDIIALAKHYGITNVQLFGSAAKGTDTENSDIDLLIDPILPVTDGFGFIKFQSELSVLLNRKVDVIFRSGLLPQLKERILKESIKL